MHEQLTGIGITNGSFQLDLCLSFNVFTFGVEFYDGVFTLRCGPIVLMVGW